MVFRWWFRSFIVFFSLKLGEMIQFDSYVFQLGGGKATSYF